MGPPAVCGGCGHVPRIARERRAPAPPAPAHAGPAVQAAREKEESMRRAEEARRREEERINREFAEAEAEEVRKILAERGLNIKGAETLDKRSLLQKEFELKAKEQSEFEARMAKLARSMDHLERARREEAMPFLKADMAARTVEMRVHYEREQAAALARHRAKWEADVAAKRDAAKLMADQCAASRRAALRSRGRARRAGVLGSRGLRGDPVTSKLPAHRTPGRLTIQRPPAPVTRLLRPVGLHARAHAATCGPPPRRWPHFHASAQRALATLGPASGFDPAACCCVQGDVQAAGG
jgi:hypothetical protein